MQATLFRITFVNFLSNFRSIPNSSSTLAYVSCLYSCMPVTAAAIRGGVTIQNTIHIFLIGFCSIIKIKMTEIKVELKWTE